MARMWVWLKSICSWRYEPHLKCKGSFKDSQWKCKYFKITLAMHILSAENVMIEHLNWKLSLIITNSQFKGIFVSYSSCLSTYMKNVLKVSHYFKYTFITGKRYMNKYKLKLVNQVLVEPRHEISNNVACATSNASDQLAHTRILIRAFASRLNILWVLSYWPNF